MGRIKSVCAEKKNGKKEDTKNTHTNGDATKYIRNNSQSNCYYYNIEKCVRNRDMFVMRIMCIKISVDMCAVTIDYNIFMTEYLHKLYSIFFPLKLKVSSAQYSHC